MASWCSVAGDESESEAESEHESEDPLEIQAEESAAKIRKRAGVPELVLDQLPSSITSKMLTLNWTSSSIFLVGLP